jgi:hypothetical protein
MLCVHRIPLPTFVTIAKRPSDGGGTQGNLPMILIFRKSALLRQINATGNVSFMARM